jgi:hypothetical protein
MVSTTPSDSSVKEGIYMDNLTADLISRIERLEARLGTQVTTASAEADGATTAPRAEHVAAEPSSRRELLRYGAVALGAAAAAGMAASPVEAADGGAVIISGSNTGTGTTSLTTTNGFGFYARSTAGAYGILGESTRIGASGTTSSAQSSDAGVQGVSFHSTGEAPGVDGLALSPNAPGVLGTNLGGGSAVRAEVPAGVSANAIALYALNYSSYTGGGPGAGGFAIYGLSAKGHGLVGATAAAGAAAVVGATNGVAGAYAAVFFGPVIVSGNFTVVGGAKSAAVPHPDGTHRRLYCMESPESWFEDFGEGALVCGEASIALDSDFAAVVDASRYHVFLTAHSSNADLAVIERSPDGFRVRGSEGAEGTFSWRVVAKRKDIAAPRFELVEIPKEPTLPPVPDSVHQEVSEPPDSHRPMANASQRPKRNA